MKTKTEMSKVYNPHDVEKRLYDWWEARGYFKPEVNQGKQAGLRPFVISMPPPNITGALHIGHAMTATVEDIMIRWHRMMGYPSLWVPGSDHAGIATQNVVERALVAEGTSRREVGREKFVERVWAWRSQYGNRITEQHRRLGASCDWDRERFTLDEGLSRAVRTAFVRLHEQGLIYRGTYLVNWCPRCGTAVSDLEVIHQEAATKLWYVRYPLEGGGEIQVATTRPETILGDTAVAVNPEDERYSALVGRTAILPVLERRIPIIADDVVDKAFGTGAVKVTPAHDPTDYEMGLRHGLPQVNVLNEDGTMNDNAGPFVGMDRFECRKALVERLKADGLLVKIQDYGHAVGHCQRCDTIIEPRISTQWFVKIKPLAEPALEVVRNGRIRIVPERFAKVYYNWMENIRDWCISRQLWWGHRIPVWYCDDCGKETVATVDPTTCAHCGSAKIHQDPDVLDTWFSSGLWPFSTLGWPDDTSDLRTYYPTTVMETGYDILFFWVARMIMLGLAMTGDIPFSVVYLHGLVRDEFGRKYSKSLGNALDPIDVIEEFGTDALRFSLVTSSTPGDDAKLSVQKVEAARNFANKIWQAARFVVSNVDDDAKMASGDFIGDQAKLSLPDRWILSRHNCLIAEVDRLMRDYQFGEAGRQIRDFLWGEFCDWYIEISKTRLYGDDPAAKTLTQQVLVYVLERTMRLLHPFMPFVTEEIWQYLPHDGDALIIAPWLEAGPVDENAERDMDLIMEIVRAIRNARAEYNVAAGRPVEAIIAAGDRLGLLEAQKELLVSLTRVDASKLTMTTSLQQKPEKALSLVIGGLEVYLPLAGLVDLDAERARLAAEVAETEAAIARSEELLGRPGFREKAPAHVVAREEERLAEHRTKLEKLRERLETLR